MEPILILQLYWTTRVSSISLPEKNLRRRHLEPHTMGKLQCPPALCTGGVTEDKLDCSRCAISAPKSTPNPARAGCITREVILQWNTARGIIKSPRGSTILRPRTLLQVPVKSSQGCDGPPIGSLNGPWPPGWSWGQQGEQGSRHGQGLQSAAWLTSDDRVPRQGMTRLKANTPTRRTPQTPPNAQRLHWKLPQHPATGRPCCSDDLGAPRTAADVRVGPQVPLPPAAR